MLNRGTKIIAQIGYPMTTFKSSMIYNPWFEKHASRSAVRPNFPFRAGLVFSVLPRRRPNCSIVESGELFERVSARRLRQPVAYRSALKTSLDQRLGYQAGD
jgi:hypothetical protein